MSIDMYLSSSRRQAASVKNMVNRQLEGYNELEQAINQFVFNSNMLTGQAYDSAKRHYSSVLLPLVKGGKLLSQAVAKAVQKFPDEYVSRVHTGDLKESELEGKIKQLEAQIRAKREQQAYLRSLSLQLPSEERGAYSRSQRSLGTLIDMLETLVKKLKEKLQKLREFNISSVNIFTEIEGLKRNISAGTQIAGNSWNGSVFVAPSKSQMTWANEINNRWNQEEAKIIEELKKYDVSAYILMDADGNPTIHWQIDKDGKGIKNPELYRYLQSSGQNLDPSMLNILTYEEYQRRVKEGWRNGYNYATGETYNKVLSGVIAGSQYIEDGYTWLTESELGSALMILGFTYASYKVTTTSGTKEVKVKQIDKMKSTEINNLSLNDLRSSIPKDWKIFENNGRVHIKDGAGQMRVRIDPPDKITKYQHMHIYDEVGNPLDKLGNIVDRTSPDGHLPWNDN